MFPQRRASIPFADNFYEVFLRNCPVFVFVKDSRFNIVYGNEAFLSLYAPEQRAQVVVGAPPSENFAGDKKALDEDMSEIVEEITDWRGQQLILQTREIRFLDEAGNVRILGISSDITRLAAQEEMLARSKLALENFAAMAAQGLRSPLGSVQSSLELLAHDKDSILSTAARKHIRLMTTCLGGLIEQVGTLLSSYKIEEKRKDTREECDLSLLFEEVKFNLSRNIDNTSVKILSGALPHLSVNRPLFRQLLHNLIENSIKYRSMDKPVIILRHALERKGHRFSVEDNSPGVLPESREAIFGLYTPLDPGVDGAGTGLALCRKIVEIHGGRIWLDEAYKAGCRICFTIPA